MIKIKRQLQKVSALETSKTERSTAQLRKDVTGIQSVAQARVERRTHKDYKVCNHISTNQTKTDPTNHRAKAESEALWDDWRITNVDKSGHVADTKHR